MKKILLLLSFCFLFVAVLRGNETTITFSEQAEKEEIYKGVLSDINVSTDDNFTLTFSKGYIDNMVYDAQYFSDGSAIRLYARGTMDVSAKTGFVIKKIVVHFNVGRLEEYLKKTTGNGTYTYTKSEPTGTYTSKDGDTQVVFTQDYKEGHSRIAAVTVTYESTASSTKVETPTTNIAFTEELTIGDSFTISSITDGAKLYGTIGAKTLDGAELPYTYTVADADITAGKIEVNVTAKKETYEDSETLTGSYTVVAPTPAAPEFSMASGSVDAGTEVFVTYNDAHGAKLQLYAGETAVEGTSYTVYKTVTLKAVVTNKYGKTAENVATYYVVSKYMLSDELTIEDAGIQSKETYTNFEITTKNGAAYAGRTANMYNSFAINGVTYLARSERGSGIFMTKSVGNVSKVIITWDTHSNTDKSLAIYGKNEPYEAYASEDNEELLKYCTGDEKAKGTELATLKYDGSTTTAEYIVEGQYRYLMILPVNELSLYLQSIKFVWDDAYTGGEESTYTLLEAGKSVSNGIFAVLVSGNIAVSRTNATQGAEVEVGENNVVLEKAQTDVDEFEVVSSGNTISGKSGFYLYGGVENEVVNNRHYLGTPAFVTEETKAAEFYVDDEARLRYADGEYFAYVDGSFVKSSDSTGAVNVYCNTSGKTTGVEAVEMEDADAPVEYFNLQGVRVANPQNGLYIIRQGNKARKQIIR